MKEWIKELCPDIADWQAELIAEEAAKKREWVGLTEAEFLEAAQIAERGNYLVAFQRIQTALKEKNT